MIRFSLDESPGIPLSRLDFFCSFYTMHRGKKMEGHKYHDGDDVHVTKVPRPVHECRKTMREDLAAVLGMEESAIFDAIEKGFTDIESIHFVTGVPVPCIERKVSGLVGIGLVKRTVNGLEIIDLSQQGTTRAAPMEKKRRPPPSVPRERNVLDFHDDDARIETREGERPRTST
jgi:hypothetical protein